MPQNLPAKHAERYTERNEFTAEAPARMKPGTAVRANSCGAGAACTDCIARSQHLLTPRLGNDFASGSADN